MDLDRLNSLTPEQAEQGLLACCGSKAWARAMTMARPFSDVQGLRQAADQLWFGLGEADWLEAFAAHPPIGTKKKTSAWSAEEQAGVRGEALELLERLATANEEYFAKFGFVFLICATGLTGREMLTELERRLPLTKSEELHNAAQEQAKITLIRLEKWL